MRVCEVNSNTPCWKFFEIPQGQERGSKCKKCEAIITCVDKKGKLSTTGLNAHLRGKHGNQLDVGATLLIQDIEKMENPTPRAKITSMLKTVSKEEQVERSDRKSPTSPVRCFIGKRTLKYLIMLLKTGSFTTSCGH